MENYGGWAALVASMVWTLTAVANERYTKNASPMMINFGRILLGFVLITILSYVQLGRLIWLGGTPIAYLWLFLSGAIGFALGDTYLMRAFHRLGARLTLLMYSAVPVITAIAGYFLFDEKLSARNILGMFLVLAGIVWVISAQSQKKSERINVANLMDGVIATLCQAVGVILSKSGIQSLAPVTGTQMRILGGILGMILLITLVRKWPDLDQFRLKNVQGLIVANAVLATFIGVSLSMVALKYTKAAVASTLMSLMPVMILPISIFILKEKLNVKEIAGAIISVVGITVLFL